MKDRCSVHLILQLFLDRHAFGDGGGVGAKAPRARLGRPGSTVASGCACARPPLASPESHQHYAYQIVAAARLKITEKRDSSTKNENMAFGLGT
eukprot:6212649-Pleurochrysis_carterae.AAC.1